MEHDIIAASILNSDFSKLAEQIKEAEDAGIDWVHLDIMDGHFVPNISYGPHVASVCRKITSLPIDTHLMINNPNEFIPKFAEAGVDKISVHIEGNANVHRTLQSIIQLEISPGIVVNPGTPVESIYSVLNLVDFVLVMTVNPGFGGQSFLPEMLIKIKQLSKRIEDMKLSVLIEVDGGIDDSTIRKARIAGADIFVVGSFIFKNKSGIKEAVQNLRSSR